MKYWEKGADSRCPNYSRLNKDAAYLTVCRSLERTKLFNTHVAKIKEWLISHKTQPDLYLAII